jgi:hypothetical protein
VAPTTLPMSVGPRCGSGTDETSRLQGSVVADSKIEVKIFHVSSAIFEACSTGNIRHCVGVMPLALVLASL